MKVVLLIAVIVLIAVIASAQEQPAYPMWPVKFTADFEESFTYPVLGTHTTAGSFYYDAASGRYRVDRDDGRYDRYCGLNGFKWTSSTRCNQYVTPEGDRFLHYPDKDNYCCYCCSAEHGCGILKQSWVQGAEFLGEVEYEGYTAYKWDQKGLQSNFYIETVSQNPEDRIMLDINQLTNDDQVYDPTTWNLEFEDSELEVPSICKKSKSCSYVSVCFAARNL